MNLVTVNQPSYVGNRSIYNVTIIIWRDASVSAVSTVTNGKSMNYHTRNECNGIYCKHKLFYKDERTIIHRYFLFWGQMQPRQSGFHSSR